MTAPTTRQQLTKAARADQEHTRPVHRRERPGDDPGDRRDPRAQPMGRMLHQAPPTGPTAYARDANLYDSRTTRFDGWRRRLVELLPLRPGDVVLDVGCGTGLCFPHLQERVGPDGMIAGVDGSPDMLDLAARRVAERGWRNVRLQRADAADIEFAGPVDHALFCAVHDVLQSEAALSAVLAHSRPGGSIAAGGGKWAPAWAVGVNVMVMTAHAPFVRDFAGFDRPWARLAERVVDLRVDEVAMGGGYVAVGRVPER